MKKDMKTQDLPQEWDSYWKRIGKGRGRTWLGSRMTRAKQNTVGRLLSDLNIKTVLDVGCGLGHLLEVFDSESYEALGIDSSSVVIDLCREKGLNVRHGRLEDMDQTFDLVASDGLLEHEIDFVPTARHMMRLSHDYVLLIQPNHESFTGKTLVYLAGLLRRGAFLVYEYNYRMSDFTHVFQKGGFELKRDLPVFGNVFRILLFKKSSATGRPEYVREQR